MLRWAKRDPVDVFLAACLLWGCYAIYRISTVEIQRSEARGACLVAGFPEFRLAHGGYFYNQPYFCVRRVNGSDSVVSVDRLPKVGR